ncbi:MAG: ArsR family transcriptional regulator [Gammaproteobacteria bacterium]|nr:ArsR family transcriptional regulator [Gammaproteobacteria bacterium]
MIDYRDRHAALLRRMLLEALERERGYIAPELLLQGALEAHGMVIGLDRLHTELAWLAEQGLVEYAGDAALLTTRGVDVALGRADVPGVQRRPPGGIIGAGVSLLAARLRGDG